jgi:hypothetical protein
MKTKPNDPINVLYDEPNVHQDNGGLTKREYFAAMAMQGFIAANREYINAPTAGFIAALSCELSDALIEKLNKTRTEYDYI